ncbi:MAG: HEPN domain-containing protein [Phormidesmis sp. CAN_BIN44]|nr:HEPN domain-containing protein [Phormidesmis sp. CAN_BIN44]
MSFDWGQYLTLAEELSRKSTTPANLEARQRTAISRAYYAAFVSARNYLRDYKKLPIPQTGEAHRDVAQQFRLNAETSNRTIADNLRRLRLYRNQADYTDKFPGLTATTEIVLELSEEVISILESLR